MLKVGDRVECIYNKLFTRNAHPEWANLTGVVLSISDNRSSGSILYHNGSTHSWSDPDLYWKLIGPKYKRNLPEWW
jgi:hypothetical protein